MRSTAIYILSALLLINASYSEASQATYPAILHGTWEPGPYPCQLPLTYDSDAGFEIKPNILIGYEHRNRPVKIQQMSVKPRAWRIESIEEYGGQLASQIEIFVLSKDSIVVTNGSRAETYNRCRTPR